MIADRCSVAVPFISEYAFPQLSARDARLAATGDGTEAFGRAGYIWAMSPTPSIANQRALVEAEQMMRDARIDATGVGTAHPRTSATMRNLATCLGGQGKHAEAALLRAERQGPGFAQPHY